MKILVAPHQMSMGGSQINAIELATTVRDLGHEVVLYAPPGILDPMVERAGLHRVVRPSVSDVSLASIRALDTVVKREQIDLVHAYEWGPSVEATFGPHVRRGTPVLMTVLSMDVPEFLPSHLPMVVGTHELALAQNGRAGDVYVAEPPVDTTVNRPGDRASARERFGLANSDIVVATVCRMTSDLEKLEGTLTAIEVIGELAVTAPVVFLVVGDGDGLGEVTSRANDMNTRHGRRVVAVTGGLLDPRPAYDAADIVIGMGSSALKGLAFEKPLVVQGERGFWKLLTPSTVGEFYARGWFGRGGRGASDLSAALDPLVSDRDLRTSLGHYGLKVVSDRFSLDVIGRELVNTYQAVVDAPPDLDRAALATAAARTVKFAVHRQFRSTRARISRRETSR